MPKWLHCFAGALVVSLLAGPALADPDPFADCAPEAEAVPTTTCVVARQNNVRRVCLVPANASLLQREHLDLPLLREALRLRAEQTVELQAANKDHQIQAAQLQAALTSEQARTVAAQADADRARAALDAWFRSPVLWVGVGAVLGGALVVAVVR